MNTQKSKWVFAEGALGQHEVLVARKALRDVEVALEFAHRAWRTWVLNRDAGNLTTHALHNEGARWRRVIRDLCQDLRKAQEHYFSVATITPALPGEPGLEVEAAPRALMHARDGSGSTAVQAVAIQSICWRSLMIEDIIEAQGWSKTTQLELLFEFIHANGHADALADFLKEKAAAENGEG